MIFMHNLRLSKKIITYTSGIMFLFASFVYSISTLLTIYTLSICFLNSCKNINTDDLILCLAASLMQRKECLGASSTDCKRRKGPMQFSAYFYQFYILRYHQIGKISINISVLRRTENKYG